MKNPQDNKTAEEVSWFFVAMSVLTIALSSLVHLVAPSKVDMGALWIPGLVLPVGAGGVHYFRSLRKK